MIIRRISKGIKEQDWFVVGVEIMIVVVGIFIGLQVNDWNDARKDGVQEKIYLTRLHAELVSDKNIGPVNNSQLNSTRIYLDEVLRVFENNGDLNTLGKDHCAAIFASHIYISNIVASPTLVEMAASGQFSLIKSDEIKSNLSHFSIIGDGLKGLLENIADTNLLLSRKYPHLIQLDRNMRVVDETESYVHNCDYPAMKENISFNNDLVDNSTRQLAFVATVDSLEKILEDLHKSLDEELEITHEGEYNQ